MNHHRQSDRYQMRDRWTGFTLVEMLVATGLVVLIMSLFAQIYGTAISTITEQRAMGNNDQKSRILTAILQEDLKWMTYRPADAGTTDVLGILPREPDINSNLNNNLTQRGYFYISENDPLNPMDDVLQFTTEVPDQSRYSGKTGVIPTAQKGAPDGTSRFAEVAYFLRQGTLYRRVLLLNDEGIDIESNKDQPRTNADDNVYNDSNRDYNGHFWQDFDYSATRFYPDDHLWIHSSNSLGPNADLSLGLPWNRFGFRNGPPGSSGRGQPIEYVEGEFIGRLTHEETSHPDMTYPGTGIFPALNGPLDQNGVVGSFSDYPNPTQGTRVGEDILLTNVEAFDIEVWEPNLQEFVQLGGTNSGVFEGANNENPGYGTNVFDTWHSHSDISAIGTGRPPYRPLRHSPSEPNFGQWAPATPYNIGDQILAGHNNSFICTVIRSSGTGLSHPDPTNEPNWALNEPIPDNELVWRCEDNRIGLQAIRITIRYVDPQSRIPRQTTVIHSFTKPLPNASE